MDCEENAKGFNIFKGCVKKRFAFEGQLSIAFVGNRATTVKAEQKAQGLRYRNRVFASAEVAVRARTHASVCALSPKCVYTNG